MLLGVNIDHCATLRQARYRHLAPNDFPDIEPDPIELAQLCEKAGADGITALTSAKTRAICKHMIFIVFVNQSQLD